MGFVVAAETVAGRLALQSIQRPRTCATCTSRDARSGANTRAACLPPAPDADAEAAVAASALLRAASCSAVSSRPLAEAACAADRDRRDWRAQPVARKVNSVVGSKGFAYAEDMGSVVTKAHDADHGPLP